MTDLVKYDAARRALDIAVTAQEVMKVRLTAKGIEAVARVANDVEAAVKWIGLRTEAEAKLGWMLEEGEKQGIIARPGRQAKDSRKECLEPAKLREIGVTPKLSSRSRQLNGIGQRARDAMLKRFEKQSRDTGKIELRVINEALAKRNATTRRALAQELSDCAALKPTGRLFPVLYADPAWSRKAGICNRAYENSYTTMDWQDILAMPVADRLLPDAWGFVWIPRAHLLALVETDIDTPLGRCRMKIPLAWAIQIKWGFDSYSTCAVWTKTDDEFPDDHGTGLIFFDQDELLLVFKRGRGLPKPDTDAKFGSNYRARSGRHSEKPAHYRDMINAMTGSLPVLELFAREDEQHILPDNFFTWGNQSKNSAEVPTDGKGKPINHDKSTGEMKAA